MNIDQSISQLIKELGSAKITCCPYNTAWVARLSMLGHPIGEDALEWLRGNQLSDGSWGTREIVHHHERTICTLAAIIALEQCGHKSDKPRIEHGQQAFVHHLKNLDQDPAGETIAFEMLVPMLANEAGQLGVLPHVHNGVLTKLNKMRQGKLKHLAGRRINRDVTYAFSSEMVGEEGISLLDIENLQEPNGSVACSPSSTTFFLLNIDPDNKPAIDFLYRTSNGCCTINIPYVAPIGTFEWAWGLWNVALAYEELGEELGQQCKPALDELSSRLDSAKGLSAVTEFSVPDSDTTAMTLEVLHRYESDSPDLDPIFSFEAEEYFICYPFERNPSLSINIHVLSAFREFGLEAAHPSVKKIITFLRRTRKDDGYWLDKWHVSPYYTTSHLVIACAGYYEDLVKNSVEWILRTQNQDGSWGYYLPTAEETAYCLQALHIWSRTGHHVPWSVIEAGTAWLAEKVDQPYPPLWTGKSLYSPILVVRSAILSALAMAE